MVLSVIGVVLFFHPIAIPAAQVVGFVVAAVAVLSNSGASLLGRYVNRAGHIHPLTVTVVSMGVGGVVMLVIGLLAQGLPPLSLSSWAIVGWLAVVNTAFAFTLWNQTLRTLTAMQSSIINNTMMIQIAILAWLFLDERITLLKGVGMLVAAVGTLLVQLRKRE
jgi:drug/metabolite transporter (DMT)-like permease